MKRNGKITLGAPHMPIGHVHLHEHTPHPWAPPPPDQFQPTSMLRHQNLGTLSNNSLNAVTGNALHLAQIIPGGLQTLKSPTQSETPHFNTLPHHPDDVIAEHIEPTLHDIHEHDEPLPYITTSQHTMNPPHIGWSESNLLY